MRLEQGAQMHHLVKAGRPVKNLGVASQPESRLKYLTRGSGEPGAWASSTRGPSLAV